MNKLEIENGKYQIENNNGIVKVYRYGELWLDGVTKFELCLIQRIEELETQLSINTSHMKQLQKHIEELQLEVNDWQAEVQKWQKFYKESEKSHLETKELLHFMINENKRLAKESIKYRELLSDIANLAYYKEQDGEYYENLLKQVMLFARRTLEGYKNN